MTTQKTAQQVAEIFGCTVEQAKDQFKANAQQMRKMAAKAIGKKVNGFTHEQLIAKALAFEIAAA
jgi:hypothetical protein